MFVCWSLIQDYDHKKTFQLKANGLMADKCMSYIVKKFEQVQGRRGVGMGGYRCGYGGEWVPNLTSLNRFMSSGYMGTPPPQQTDTTENITFLHYVVGGKNTISVTFQRCRQGYVPRQFGSFCRCEFNMHQVMPASGRGRDTVAAGIPILPHYLPASSSQQHRVNRFPSRRV